MSELKIAEVLFSYYQKLLKYYPEGSILGVFLYGSQNYQFSWEGSDIDAKAIYIPSKEEIALLKKPVSKEYQFDSGHVEVKDIRLMWQMWKKQNMNFVEILFTNYYLTNKWYTDKWETILELKEQIAHYDPSYAITSAYYQAYNTLRSDITGKKLANAARIALYLDNYLKGEDYKRCITLTEEQKNFYLPYKVENKLFSESDNEVVETKQHLDELFQLSNEIKINSELQKKLDDKMAALIISFINIRKGREFSKL